VTDLVFSVADLVGRPGERRQDSGSVDLDLVVGASRVHGPAVVEVTLEGVDSGLLARFEAHTTAHLACTRCLREWDEPLHVSAMQLFEEEPDEDGYGLGPNGTIDLTDPVRDEVALSVPLRPLCRPGCAGLCPTCGTDLNENPCGGHDEPSSSPFDALRGLFEDRDEET
jgi:uncharacterized protein